MDKYTRKKLTLRKIVKFQILIHKIFEWLYKIKFYFIMYKNSWNQEYKIPIIAKIYYKSVWKNALVFTERKKLYKQEINYSYESSIDDENPSSLSSFVFTKARFLCWLIESHESANFRWFVTPGQLYGTSPIVIEDPSVNRWCVTTPPRPLRIRPVGNVAVKQTPLAALPLDGTRIRGVTKEDVRRTPIRGTLDVFTASCLRKGENVVPSISSLTVPS